MFGIFKHKHKFKQLYARVLPNGFVAVSYRCKCGERTKEELR